LEDWWRLNVLEALKTVMRYGNLSVIVESIIKQCLTVFLMAEQRVAVVGKLIMRAKMLLTLEVFAKKPLNMDLVESTKEVLFTKSGVE